MTISPIHAKVVTKLAHILIQNLSSGYIVRQEKPITIGDSEPEPDISGIQRILGTNIQIMLYL